MQAVTDEGGRVGTAVGVAVAAGVTVRKRGGISPSLGGV